MRVLCLNPYSGLSHEQFVRDWSAHSSHDFTVLSLPPRHFKWRIRQASVGLARKAAELAEEGEEFDLIFSTSMLDAAELRGLLPAAYRNLPLTVYFHENQLNYPVRRKDQRDSHFSLINWVSALSAESVWFNSEYNRTSFQRGLREMLKKMPDEQSLWTLPRIRERSVIQPLGIRLAERAKKSPGPLHIAWVARWEHDKRPDVFFAALNQLKVSGVPFKLTVLGQSFQEIPPVFEEARKTLSEEIVHFGFVKSRAGYLEKLKDCDLVVSSSAHEFFGVALLEAVSLGCLPVVPDRLVYPEIYPEACLYQAVLDGPVGGGLRERLEQLSNLKGAAGTFDALYDELKLEQLCESYGWAERAPALDAELSKVLERGCLPLT